MTYGNAPSMRPRVIVNCAMSPDGKIAGAERRQLRISSPEDMERVKRLRTECQAILVGAGTILADDPHLTVKGLPREKQALRVVLDPRGKVPENALVLDERARTLMVTLEDCARQYPGAETVRLGKGTLDLSALLDTLGQRGISNLLVEGGGETIYSFFRAGLVDVYSVFVGDFIIGGRESPTPVDGDGFRLGEHVPLRLISFEQLGSGVHLTYEVRHDA
ncbi:MAG: 2,5-diamino-6-ribosylamino-4(3H)-pyrimidinone 5'-phosphate reductase [Methanomassiliicoccales archaeon PtaB.Bin215]|nr:MAG: 2,5-diamino-6-ribosylamino-4(3H)-pyrimidinone 5'-phosphate reductase [Methanomassiliicoccales archaeon PtaB.Bin215]